MLHVPGSTGTRLGCAGGVALWQAHIGLERTQKVNGNIFKLVSQIKKLLKNVYFVSKGRKLNLGSYTPRLLEIWTPPKI